MQPANRAHARPQMRKKSLAPPARHPPARVGRATSTRRVAALGGRLRPGNAAQRAGRGNAAQRAGMGQCAGGNICT